MSDILVKCVVCQALIDEEDLFCANCGLEAPPRETVRRDAAQVARHNFQCDGCGASMSYDASAGSLRCPFCGSVDLTAKQDHRVVVPERVAPFRLEQHEAIAVMRRWLSRGFWRPGDLQDAAMVVGTTAVYVPYWVFRAETHTYWTADTDRTPIGARGNWFPLAGEHRGSYEGLLVGASGALAPAETAAICPFELAAGVVPEEVDLDNVTVEEFAVSRKYARPLARQGLESSEAAACQERYVPGKARNVHVNVRIQGLSSTPVLLPVWIMAYRYRDRVFRFVVNGQTGKATGGAPTSWRKIAAAVGVGAAALALLALLALLAASR